MKRLILVFIILCFFCAALSAQNKAVMQAYQEQLSDLFERVYNAPTDNERYLACESATTLLDSALRVENSIKWKWIFGNRVSVLTASDKKFRIFTWPVRRDNGEVECFGMVQAYDEREEEWVVTTLHDKSQELFNIEESVFEPNQWLGAVYQSLVEESYDGKHYYMLLGWTSVDMLTQRKVIEPISFKRDGGVPQFGLAAFRRDPNRRRVVLWYSADAMVNLRYETQFTQYVEKKRVKVKGAKRPQIQTINHDEQHQMIIFDEVLPQVPGMEGLFQYYVPTGLEMAYIFNKGKWDLKTNAQGRLEDKRLNKDFAPLPKSAPQYSMKRSEE